MYAGILDVPANLPGNLAWPRRGLSRTGKLVLVRHAGLPFACLIPHEPARCGCRRAAVLGLRRAELPA